MAALITNSAKGKSTVASVTATLGFTATAGRVLVLTLVSDTTISGTPSGWTQPSGGAQVAAAGHYLYYKVAAGGETTASYTLSGAHASAWQVLEISGLNTSSLLDVSAGSNGTSSSSITSASITPTSGERFAVASIVGMRSDANMVSVDDWTNSFTDRDDSTYLLADSLVGNSAVIGTGYRAVTGDGVTAVTTTTTVTSALGAGSTAAVWSTIAVAFRVAQSMTYSVDTRNRTSGTGTQATTVSNTMSVTTGDVIVVLAVWPDQNEGGTGTYSISNTNGGTITWTALGTGVNVASNCRIMGWWGRATASSASFTVTVTQPTANDVARTLYTIVHTGAHATTPVPSGKIVSGSSTTDVASAMTPTAAGSALWMVAADWGATNTFAARANCTLQSTVHVAGLYSNTLIRPTEQPRSDAGVFTLGETDTSGTIGYIGFEVQAAAASTPTQSQAPRSMHQYRMRLQA